MICESCGASVFETELACAECGRELRLVRRPEEPQPEAPLLPEAEPVPASVPPLAENTPRCPSHFDSAGTATCARCGRFCCAVCLPEPKRQPHCAECQQRLAVEALPHQRTALRRELTVSFYFAAVAMIFFGSLVPNLLGNDVNVFWGMCFAIPQLVVALLFTFVPRAGVAIAAIALQLMAATFNFWVSPLWVGMVFLLYPLVTILWVMKWRWLMGAALTQVRVAS